MLSVVSWGEGESRKQSLKSDEYRQPYYGDKKKSFLGEMFAFD